MSRKKLRTFPSSRGFAIVGLIACLLGGAPLLAADLEMVDGYGNITGVIDASRRGLLVIENSGDQFFYQRAREYDLPDGRYLGFYNHTLNRIIRFPRSGRGPIERADLDTIYPQFRPASVSVRPIGSGPGFGPYLQGWLGPPNLSPSPGYSFYSGTWYGGRPYGAPWRGGPGYGGPGFGRPGFGGWPYFGGYYHSGVSISVATPPIFNGATAAPLYPDQPQSTLIESRVIDDGKLPPVEMEFINTQNETLLVTLSDAQHPGKQPQYKIAPGGSQRVKLPRSAGQTRINRYQTWDAAGNPTEREVRVPIDPQVRYEVTVDRLRIQSIAIDRTGTSPNEIEDINMQSVRVGGFSLPPDDQLLSDTIDVFAAAQR
ncbi:hypothetical protein [Allorhodopirellula heiligendammensis]|uniref:Uncharacterized protein n=1 Tax=Allorhodopirellula heiligendammensis TaxID=2714739 RepID=A0A5C6C087_9BACT|nr:hypothetical protein [Allorhodopirellula heiligendammensis]TWU16289.1 hypothetical protein Poly21_34940 [Allorhodopirellula heiligendammensis]